MTEEQSEEKTIKTAIENMNTYLDECHYDGDTVTITAKVLRSIRDNYCELLRCKKAIERLKNILRKASTEPERLRTTHDRVREFDEIRRQIKSEAIKEFAEKVKNMSEDCTDYGQEYVLCKDIDKLAKEMVGE